MDEQNAFQDRIARISANKPAPRPRAQPRPAPKSSFSLAGLTLPAAIIAIATVVFALNFESSGLATDPFAALEQSRAGDTKFERCVNDLTLQAKLKAQGHENPRFAAMLMCG